MAAGATGDVYAKLAAGIAATSGPFDPTTVSAMQNLGLTGAVAQAASSLAVAPRRSRPLTYNAGSGSAICDCR